MSAVAGLIADFPSEEIDPGDLPLRTHEIMENSLEFQLTGTADYGSGTTLATAYANTQGTAEILGLLAPLLRAAGAGGAVGRTAGTRHGAGRPAGRTGTRRALDTCRRAQRRGAGTARRRLRLAAGDTVAGPRHPHAPGWCLMRPGRRDFLRGVSVSAAVVTAAGAAAFGGTAFIEARDPGQAGSAAPSGRAFGFEGAHQAGIVTPQQQAASFCSFDVVAGSARRAG